MFTVLSRMDVGKPCLQTSLTMSNRVSIFLFRIYRKYKPLILSGSNFLLFCRPINWALLVPVFLLIACNPSESDTATITITDQYKGPRSYILSHEPFFEDVVLQSGNIDSSNVISFKLSSPMTVKLILDSVNQRVYLEPGFSLTIGSVSAANGFTFSGKGSVINNALSAGARLFDRALADGLLDLEKEPFLDKLDSLRQDAQLVSRQYMESLPETHRILLQKFIAFRLFSARLEYGFHFHNSALINQIYAFQKNEIQEKFEFPNEFDGLREGTPMDTLLFNAEIDGYKDMLYHYLLECVHNSVFEVQNWNKPDPIKSHEMLITTSLPPSIKEYLVANNFRHWVATIGISPPVDRIYSDFNARYPNSPYRKSLDRLYEKHLAIQPGSEAPAIVGERLDGTPFSSDELGGKLVYVDVWATWCAPCVQEIPSSIRIQSEFEEYRDLVFLNVSVDKDVDSWRSMLAKKTDWKGIHIVLNKDQAEALENAYKVNGYPKYFIINNGRIVNAKAPRPSEVQLKKILDELLKES